MAGFVYLLAMESSDERTDNSAFSFPCPNRYGIHSIVRVVRGQPREQVLNHVFWPALFRYVLLKLASCKIRTLVKPIRLYTRDRGRLCVGLKMMSNMCRISLEKKVSLNYQEPTLIPILLVYGFYKKPWNSTKILENPKVFQISHLFP